MLTQKVRIWPLRLIAFFCALSFLFSAVMTGTYAWQNEQKVLNNVYGTEDTMVSVELVKYEKMTDGTKTENPIANTVFYLYRENGEQIGERYITDKNGKINIMLPAGNYYFEEVSPSIGYTFDTDSNGKLIKKYYFTVDEKENTIIVKAYNKRTDGNLQIRKTVENADGSPLSEIQQTTAFEFTVTFSDGGTYSYKIDDGQKRQLTSGDTLELTSGQTAVFESLPVGVLYNVVETPVEGYVISSTGHRGNITEDSVAIADFVNRYEQVSEKTVKLRIKKVLAGEYWESDKERDFNMTLKVDGESTDFTLKADEIKEFEIPAGSVYQVSEDNYIGDGFSQSIVNGAGTAVDEVTEVVVTNTYVAEPRVEIVGQKTWDMNGCDNVELPESITVQLKNGDLLIEEKVVKPDSNNEWNYSFIVPKYNADGTVAKYTLVEDAVPNFRATYNGYNIKNTYVKPIHVTLPTITKEVKGDEAPKTSFEFVFTGQHGTPMPVHSEGYKKVLKVNGAGELKIGTITYDEEGTYVYSINEINGGDKGWTYDTTTYTVTVVVTEKDYALTAKTTVEKHGTKVDDIVFTNTFESKTGEMINVSGTKTWKHGNNAKKNYPESIIVEVYADGILAVQRQVTASNNWKYSFKLPRFAKDGHEIVYTIDEADVEDYKKQIVGYNLINIYTGTPDVPDDPDKPDVPDEPDEPDVPGSPNAPLTGYNINLGVMFMLMFFSLIGLIVGLFMFRRQYGSAKRSKT